jgi:type II secretory pathway component PulK
MNARVSQSLRCRGSALMLVLWCVMLLSVAVFAVVEMVGLSVDHASYESAAIVAQAQATSGVAVGEVPQLMPDDPILQQAGGGAGGFAVTIGSEGARLNLNYLLLTSHRDVLVNLFTAWGIGMTDAQHAADCLYDWVTPGDLPSLNGAKAAAYAEANLPQRPTHQAFQSWSEVEQVMGVDRIAAARPDWEESFTLWSEGPLDLSTAPADRIAAVFGMPEGRLEALVKMRNGRDGIPGTADDVPINAPLLQAQLGLTSQQMSSLGSEFAFSSAVRRIHSVGRSGAAHASLTVITRLGTSPPQYFVWSER